MFEDADRDYTPEGYAVRVISDVIALLEDLAERIEDEDLKSDIEKAIDELDAVIGLLTG